MGSDKCFQDNRDINASDFVAMIKNMPKTYNGKYSWYFFGYNAIPQKHKIVLTFFAV